MPPAQQTIINLDWLRDPPPPTTTAFQRLVRAADWENSSIGPVAVWPRELRQMVRLIVADPCPKVLYWGPRCTVIYNEACVPLIGAKHPIMMGRDAPEVFSEFWASFDGLLADQRSTGETFVGDASMLLMERHGFLEETYFDWKLVPIISDEGLVLGSYGIPSDLTRDVIALRRTDCIKDLAHHISKCTSFEDLWQTTLSSLAEDEKDLPLVLLYSVEEQSSLASAPSSRHFTCHLAGSNGIQPDHPLARGCIDARHDVDGLASEVVKALAKDEIRILKTSDPRLRGLMDGVGWRGYGLSSYESAIVPIKVDGTASAFILVGLNPYRRYNEAYHEFLQIIGEVLGPQISKIRLSEEVMRRAEVARKATSDFHKSELRFDKFAKRSSVGLAVAGADRNLMYANNAWYEFSGMDSSKKNYNYDDWLSTVYEGDRPLALEWWEKVLKQKKEGRFQYRSKVPFQQGHMHSKNRTAICTVHPDLNEAREVESIMILVMDISELKWIEEQLRIRTKALEESEGKYRNYAEHCPLGIVRTNGEGYVQYGGFLTS
jgi:PAS domain-containing protein